MDKVTYTVTVDRDMFPFAPGSEVVVRSYHGDEWKKGMFQVAHTTSDHRYHRVSFGDAYDFYEECHPLSTHGHLLGTTYSADTPACAVCGKAQPDCVCSKITPRTDGDCRSCPYGCMQHGVYRDICANCKGTPVKPTDTTADGVTVKEGDVVWHSEHGKGIAGHSRAVFEDQHSLYLCDCYSRPCARLADDSVAMVECDVCIFEEGEMKIATLMNTRTGNIGAFIGDWEIKPEYCYPIGSRVMTPAELDAGQSILDDIVEERDKLRAELDALKAKPLRDCATCPHRTDDAYGHCDDCPSKNAKAKETPPTQPGDFQPFQRVLVRDHDSLPWRAALYSYKNSESRHHCCDGTWWHVLPFDGNEHLLGTTDSPLKCTKCGAVGKTTNAPGIGPVCECGSDGFE